MMEKHKLSSMMSNFNPESMLKLYDRNHSLPAQT